MVETLLANFINLPVMQPVTMQYYVFIDLETLGIVSVGEANSSCDSLLKIEVQQDLYIKFITGEENTASWILGPDRSIVKKEHIKPAEYNLVDILRIMSIEFTQSENADVKIIIDTDNNTLKIFYSFEQINLWQVPLKLYFTRYQDPAYLKSTVDINMNTLFELRDKSSAKKIPNPLIVSVQEADDLSIYTPRTDLKFSVEVI